MGKTPLERLYIKSEKMLNGCIEWRGSRFKNRGKPTYGQMWYEGTNTRAHIVSWKEHVGPVPKGLCVLHKCDNPICINPLHLFLGTIKDNNRDCINKGRKAVFPGETNGRSKLTPDEVREIRRFPSEPYDVGRIFGVSRETINMVWSGRKWADVK